MCKLLLKRKVIISVILSLFLIISLWYLSIHFQQSDEATTSMQLKRVMKKIDQSLTYECCIPLNLSRPRANIYFLKTHKTGSSTIQNIILRFALRHSLDVMCPNLFMYYYPISKETMEPFTWTPNNKYNVLAHHIRYTSKLASFQYPDTVTVTVLRNPVTLFPSLYEYFYMTETNGMTLQQLLNSPVKPSVVWGLASPWIYRGYNQMSYDLGFELEKYANDQAAIEEFIRKIDREFDFVMIMEHMEASLVLLANLMGWPLEYMVHLRLNARPPDPNAPKLTADQNYTIEELNHVDTVLYHHFERKFRKCVRQYGEERLQEQIMRLRKLNEEFYERCVEREVMGGDLAGILEAVSHIPKNESDLECVYATQLSLTLEQNIKEIQMTKLHFNKPLPKL